MPREKLKLWSNTSLIWSRGSLSIFQSRKIQLTRNWQSSLIIIQREQSLRSCSWGKVRASISLEQRESLSRLRTKTLRSELEVDIYLSMSFLINTPLWSLKNWKEKIHWRDSVRRSLSKKRSSTLVSEKFHQSAAHLGNLNPNILQMLLLTSLEGAIFLRNKRFDLLKFLKNI